VEGRTTSLFYGVLTTAEELSLAGIPVIFTSTRFTAMRSILNSPKMSDKSRARLKMLPFSGLIKGLAPVITVPIMKGVG
jgi:hypothetical protein